jgi:hypothetical protein
MAASLQPQAHASGKNMLRQNTHRNYNRQKNNLAGKVRELDLTDAARKTANCQITSEPPHLSCLLVNNSDEGRIFGASAALRLTFHART